MLVSSKSLRIRTREKEEGERKPEKKAKKEKAKEKISTKDRREEKSLRKNDFFYSRPGKKSGAASRHGDTPGKRKTLKSLGRETSLSAN